MIDDLIPTNTTQRMTSLEIAELTEKQHKNVSRDIKNLILQGAITALSFELSEYKDSTGKKNPLYSLDFQATMILITGYDAKRRAMVIDRWLKLERGEATPMAKKTPVTLLPVDREFRAAVRMAKAAGLKGNQAILSANRLTKEMTGADPLLLLGATHIESESHSIHLTPTEIGQKLEMSAQKINQKLEVLGFQDSTRDHKKRLKWIATKDGQKYAVLKDTGKKHGDGTPVQQLQWKDDIIDLLITPITTH